MISIPMKDYATMSASQQSATLDAFVTGARSAGSSAWIKSRIQRFEMRYEISSAEMITRVAAGEMDESGEVAEWLFLLDACRASGECSGA